MPSMKFMGMCLVFGWCVWVRSEMLLVSFGLPPGCRPERSGGQTNGTYGQKPAPTRISLLCWMCRPLETGGFPDKTYCVPRAFPEGPQCMCVVCSCVFIVRDSLGGRACKVQVYAQPALSTHTLIRAHLCRITEALSQVVPLEAGRHSGTRTL